MRVKNIIFLLAAAMILCFSAAHADAAVIKGTIYNDYLEVQQNSIVEVNTVPRQQFIAKDGKYSFNVPEGEYTIRASYLEDKVLLAEDDENITVQGEGEYLLDMILFPSLSEEDILQEAQDLDVNVPEDAAGKINYVLYILYAALAILGAVLVFQVWKRIKRPKTKNEAAEQDVSSQGKQADQINELDPYVNFIKEHKRLTQKEIRKQFPLSEAKISLILTELESKGVIKKIKKGRGNIIIYNHPHHDEK